VVWSFVTPPFSITCLSAFSWQLLLCSLLTSPFHLFPKTLRKLTYHYFICVCFFHPSNVHLRLPNKLQEEKLTKAARHLRHRVEQVHFHTDLTSFFREKIYCYQDLVSSNKATVSHSCREYTFTSFDTTEQLKELVFCPHISFAS